MRKYYFKAQSVEGAVSGSIEAGSVSSAQKKLAKKGY
jgi:hypothetical protein